MSYPNTILQGDTLTTLKTLPDDSVHCVVTSPPYWGLRDYGVAGQMGLEKTPQEYIEKMTAVFEEVRRVLRRDGTLWLNMGDSYSCGGMKDPGTRSTLQGGRDFGNIHIVRERPKELKSKNLVGQPWRLAFALQAAGWYLRSDIIWHKPNPMPENVTDRPTKAHEYLFLMSKSQRYFYDAKAIEEPSVTNDARRPYGSEGSWQLDGRPKELRHGGEPRKNLAVHPNVGKKRESKNRGEFNGKTESLPGRNAFRAITMTRNKRTVWTIPSQPYKESHFATFPPELVRPCILAGCPAGGVVLDPFMGSGTVALVAAKLGRDWLGIELNPAYIQLAMKRLGLFGVKA